MGRVGAALLLVALCGGCQDLHEYRGVWSGVRVGDDPVLRVGFADDVRATLEIDEVTLHSISARLSTNDDLLADAPIRPIAGAEADVLAGMTFEGEPVRVFLAFAATRDGGGDALVVVALYGGPRVEVRLLRGGARPLYGVFALESQAS